MDGLSSARNYGVEKANGEYILFVDGDDFLANNCIEILDKCLFKKNYDLLCFNYYSFKNNIAYQKDIVNTYKEIKKENRYILSQLTAWSRVYKASFLKQNNLLFKEKIIYEDLAFVPTLINYTKNIGYIDDYLYYYVIRENSIMNIKQFNKNRDDKFIALETLEKDFKKNNSLEKYKDEIEYIHIKHLLMSYSMEILKYNEEIYKSRIRKAFELMKEKYPNWEKNKYYKNGSKFDKMYLFLLKNEMFLLTKYFNVIAQKYFNLKRKIVTK